MPKQCLCCQDAQKDVVAPEHRKAWVNVNASVPWPGSFAAHPTCAILWVIASVALEVAQIMQSLAGGSLQRLLPCHPRTCRSQTIGRAQPHVFTTVHQLNQQLKGRSKPFVPAKSGKGTTLSQLDDDQSSFLLNWSLEPLNLMLVWSMFDINASCRAQARSQMPIESPGCHSRHSCAKR